MNLKIELSRDNQKLLNELGIDIENRDYSIDEIKKYETDIANHIMSKSLKNMDLAKESVKYSSLMNILARYES